MTRSVTWVTLDAAVPMGQQLHEASLARALRACAGTDWRLSARRVASLRSGRVGAVRLPLRPVARVPYGAAAAVGRLAYGRADLVHRFDLRCPPHPNAEVLTVHDLPPLRFDDEGELPRWAAESARRAALVLCPSAFAAGEVAELLGVERVRVVPNGVDLNGAQPERPPGASGRFVLHVGGATARKNLEGLAAAWPLVARAAPDTTLVLCGPPHPRRDRLFAAQRNVVALGHVTHDRVLALMRAADAVVVPSLYEGFGLPALEGMAAGVPVVAANRGALPEVCGDAALLVEPTAEALADGILAVLEDGDALRAAGPARAAAFTWERAAAETLAVYEEAMG